VAALIGNAAAQSAFASAATSGTLHHAWLLAGPEGVGKATFARAAALRLLADAAAPGTLAPGVDVPGSHPARALMEAGSHPDFRVLSRLPKDAEKPDEDVARSITIAQVRSLGTMFATRPSLSFRRVVVIDSIDDLERGGANALLKNLEEPPAGTVFLLVSHAPGRLLPTIRSRCRLLRFERLSDQDVARVLRHELPEADEAEIGALVRASDGTPGRGLRYAGLDIGGLDTAMAAILADGDAGNARRTALAKALSSKGAAPRYRAFLERAPSYIAEVARSRHGTPLAAALDAHSAARDLAGAAIGLSLDAQATVFEMGTLIAGLHAAA